MSIDVTIQSIPITVTVQDQEPIEVTISGVSIPNIPNGTPTSATATGVAGTFQWDSNYIYVCITTNVWKRVALTSW